MMFLHSGASLHGHEYSNRPAPQPGPRRHPLLRSALTPPVNRTSSYPISAEESPPSEPVSPSEKRRRPLSEHLPRNLDAVVRFREPARCCSAATVARPETMSEEEDISSSSEGEVSEISSPARRTRRRTPRKSTTYLLAHPPPGPRSKQLIRIRPKLLLQIQQLSAKTRPTPIIDVYPSSAIAKSLIVPLLKRFPLIAGIKKELGIQDVMLVKSENYAMRTSVVDSEDDEDTIKSRELLAIFSPSRVEDKAEVVLANGTVWVVTPRLSGGSVYSYEFVSVDASGNTIKARWVRRQNTPSASRSTPGTPTSPVAPSSVLPSTDHKFTFSIIDPNSRRHPVLATLTNTSLDILDSYTTVSPSSNSYPPTSPSAPGPNGEPKGSERTTREVEGWQKSFITISAVWVILRHGWCPNCKREDVGPLSSASASSQADASSSGRNRSSSNISDAAARACGVPDASNRRRFSGALRMSEPPSPAGLPRRTMSSGASFAQRRSALADSGEQSGSGSGSEPTSKAARRAFSGDWGVELANRGSLTAIMDPPASSSQPRSAPRGAEPSDSSPAPAPASNPGATSAGGQARSAHVSQGSTPAARGGAIAIELVKNPAAPSGSREPAAGGTTPAAAAAEQEERRSKWRSMTNWLRKLQGR
ncbi:hypothetical protein GGS23DRAFT_616412 [Durotheca rogersii]|uniref:uncharacterized protein n=1 Tax=Durotheca rogersii TaxID=419775 RepID=UPI0022207CC6|nr:uncharacterized protein GGS23DRAFT_616412 [Durotheca rogersii]KAI5859311.1 hypothetical protein GGS23DRAFT_616412 [Durotheca rogersii]